jgi:predicted secreted protein
MLPFSERQQSETEKTTSLRDASSSTTNFGNSRKANNNNNKNNNSKNKNNTKAHMDYLWVLWSAEYLLQVNEQVLSVGSCGCSSFQTLRTLSQQCGEITIIHNG